jgi:Plant transposon protein
MYNKGKEGYPSVAYEVICTSRKFIQSVSCGHPAGARNDKHIFKTDPAVMGLMQYNGWLNSKAWHCSGQHGKKTFFGLYLICDGGYQAIPCLLSKNGQPDSPEMRWSKNVESVRKDIEGVFGILKIRFRFLKNFNNLREQSAVDDAFTTCCILHNMMLEKDGYLEEDLAPYPAGLEECLAKKFGKNKWNGLHGMWIRGDDDTVDRVPNANDTPPLRALPTPRFHSEADRKATRERHNRVKIALVDHFDHGLNGN